MVYHFAHGVWTQLLHEFAEACGNAVTSGHSDESSAAPTESSDALASFAVISSTQSSLFTGTNTGHLRSGAAVANDVAARKSGPLSSALLREGTRARPWYAEGDVNVELRYGRGRRKIRLPKGYKRFTAQSPVTLKLSRHVFVPESHGVQYPHARHPHIGSARCHPPSSRAVILHVRSPVCVCHYWRKGALVLSRLLNVRLA